MLHLAIVEVFLSDHRQLSSNWFSAFVYYCQWWLWREDYSRPRCLTTTITLYKPTRKYVNIEQDGICTSAFPGLQRYIYNVITSIIIIPLWHLTVRYFLQLTLSVWSGSDFDCNYFSLKTCKLTWIFSNNAICRRPHDDATVAVYLLNLWLCDCLGWNLGVGTSRFVQTISRLKQHLTT